MKNKNELAASSGRMTRLVRCCWHLGLRIGYRYWRLQNLAMADPDMVPAWCHAWRAEANVEESIGNHLVAGLLRRFAKEAEELNEKFHAANAEPIRGDIEKPM